MARRGRELGIVKTGGRKAGTPNKATAEIREYAQQYSLEAVDQLVRIMRSSKSDGARIAAIREILDRAYGKPPQALHHSGEMQLTHEQALDQIRDRLRGLGIEPPGDAELPGVQ